MLVRCPPEGKGSPGVVNRRRVVTKGPVIRPKAGEIVWDEETTPGAEKRMSICKGRRRGELSGWMKCLAPRCVEVGSRT